jgi:dephospho-CoA kinase
MPSQKPSRHSATEPVCIGFAGRIGAGKTSAANHLASSYGFQYTRYSLVLEEWLPAAAGDKDRLQQLGWDIMNGGLQVHLNSRLISGLDRSRSAAIDGLRHPIDFECLASAFGSAFRLVFLESREENRFERLHSRFSTYAAFQAADSQPVEAHIEDLRPLSGATIANDGSLESLFQRVDEWMARTGLGGQK